MRDNTAFEGQAQPDLVSLPRYLRHRAIGHPIRCAGESCFVHVERAIERYLPGFFPTDPLELRLREVERLNAVLRQENERLGNEIKEGALSTSCQHPAKKPADRYNAEQTGLRN